MKYNPNVKEGPIFCDYSHILDAPARMRIYKQCGIQSIQPPWGVDFYPPGIDRFQIYDAATKEGLEIETVHLDKNQNNDLWLPGPKGDKVVDYYIGYLTEMHERGIKLGVFHLTQGSTPPPASEIGVKRIERLAEFCEKHSLILAVENLWPLGIQHLHDVLDNIKSPALGMLFDIGHSNCLTKDGLALFERHRDRIVAVHLHNNYGINDDHNSLDDGNIDIEGFLKLENSIKYYLLELFPRNINTAKELKEYILHNVELFNKFISSKRP